ncbi:MAG: hypothetical protein PHF63_10020 [Herbinix sp.]|nr:hypothetical protein [Herbinix sp.]
MKHKKSRMQAVISCIFALILTLLFITLYVCFGFSLGVFSNRSIIEELNRSNYYNEVYDTLNKNAEELVIKAGFPATVLENVITIERVYVGGRNYVNGVLAGEEPQINTDKFRSDLTSNFDQYLTKQGITRTDDINTGVEAMISEIENEYKSSIQLQFVNYIIEYKTHFMNLMKVIIPVVTILIGILCFFLIKMRKYKHRGLRYINYALIASSCMTILAGAYLLVTKQYEKVNVTPDYYNNFLTAYLKWDIMVFMYLGGIGLLISALLISLTSFVRNRIMNS